MKKVTIVGHRHDQASLVNVLQTAGVIEIVAQDEQDEDTASPLAVFRADQIRQELSKVAFVRTLITQSQPPRSGILSGLLPDRFQLRRSDFERIGAKIDFQTIHKRARELDGIRAELDSQIRSTVAEQVTIGSWANLDVPLSDLKSSEKVAIVLGTATGANEETLRAAFQEINDHIDLTVVSAAQAGVNIAVIYFNRDQRLVEPVLAELGIEVFEPTQIGVPAAELEQIKDRLEMIRSKREGVQKEIVSLSTYSKDLKILEDWLRGQQMRSEFQSKFSGTASAFALEGWVEINQADGLADLLRQESRIVDYSVVDPAPGEDIPTQIHNPRLARPFEVLTKLYGMPNYRELDPTLLTGIFFTLFFGIALGDAGYGLVLAGFCQWLKRRLLLTPTGRQWFDLFTYGGLSSVLMGIMTGSYFGLPKEGLPDFARRMMLFDPLTEALLFLLLTLALGAIHVLLGMALEFRNSWRNNLRTKAITKDLTRFSVAFAAAAVATVWVVVVILKKESALTAFLLPITLSALGWAALIYVLSSGEFLTKLVGFASGKKRPDEKLALALFLVMIVGIATDAAFKWPLISIALLIGLALSTAFRQGLVALAGGLYNLYGLTRFLNDVLSYSRLMALGLATFLIGFVINILAGLVAGVTLLGLPVGILLAVAIALPLHVANLAINLLSAFVHPLRLQFVEFFSQFYQNGGEGFAPFTFETEHLIIEEE